MFDIGLKQERLRFIMNEFMLAIWALYSVINILWQMGLTHLIKGGFIDGDLKQKHPDAHETLINYSEYKDISEETAFRRLATVGMNMWVLPIAIVLSILVLIFQ